MNLISGSISGIVIDSNSNSLLKGVSVEFEGKDKKTNSKGEFSLKISYEDDSLPPLNFSLKGYQSLSYIPFNGDGTLKNNLLIRLEPSLVSLEKDKASSTAFNQNQINNLIKNKKDFNYFKNKKIIDTVLNISLKLSPFILTLIAEFGVTGVDQKIGEGKIKLNDLLSQTYCPTNEQLVNIINRKNKVVKQLNNALKIIELTSKGIKGNKDLITSLEALYVFLKFSPTPTAVGGVGIPISAVNNIQDLKESITDNLTKFSQSNVNSQSLVSLLEGTLLSVIDKLSLLDQLVQHCSSSGDSPISSTTQNTISTELITLTQQQSQQQSPVITNVNGFEMGVETESTTNTLKRRRAIARNKQGVVILKGEWSFSSVDQILIDELVFYIQVNDLKAD